MNTVLQMIDQAIAEGKQKVASWSPPVVSPVKESSASLDDDIPTWKKVASACGALAQTLENEPVSRQKLAEMLALYEKVAEGAPIVSDCNLSGQSLGPNESGGASDQPPRKVVLKGSQLPDTMETPPGGSGEQKVAQVRAAWLAKLASEGKIASEVAEDLIKKASREDNVVTSIAKGAIGGPKGLTKKLISDALNKHAAENSGAVITTGTEPTLSPYGLNEKVPTTNPKSRHLNSPETVADATKGDLKEINQGMSPYLDHTVSQSNDSVLQTQLDNTFNQDIKIASVKALMNKWASESSTNAQKLSSAIQAATTKTALQQVTQGHSLDDVYSALNLGEE